MIFCTGIGPGNPELLTVRARREIEEADVLCGFEAVLNFVSPLVRPEQRRIVLTYQNQPEKMKEMAEASAQGARCAVLFMGDPHFSGFQMLERVERAAKGEPVELVPGISSAQVLASRARVCFDETTFVTFHRRGDLEPFKKHLLHVLEDGRNAIVIPRPWDFMPAGIAQFLLESGASSEHAVEVWENLTGKEATWRGKLCECTQEFSDMSIILIRARVPFPSQIEPEIL